MVLTWPSWPRGRIGYAACGARIELCFAISGETKDRATEVVDIQYRAFPDAVNKIGISFYGTTCEDSFVESIGGKTVPDASGDGAGVFSALCGKSRSKEKQKWKD